MNGFPGHEQLTYWLAGGFFVGSLVFGIFLSALMNTVTTLRADFRRVMESDHVRRMEFEEMRKRVDRVAERQAGVIATLERNGFRPMREDDNK